MGARLAKLIFLQFVRCNRCGLPFSDTSVTMDGEVNRNTWMYHAQCEGCFNLVYGCTFTYSHDQRMSVIGDLSSKEWDSWDFTPVSWPEVVAIIQGTPFTMEEELVRRGVFNPIEEMVS